MLVWQWIGEYRTDTFHKTGGQALQRAGGQAWVRRCHRPGNETLERPRRQLSRRERVALEYFLAILSALASSYLILRLGL